MYFKVCVCCTDEEQRRYHRLVCHQCGRHFPASGIGLAPCCGQRQHFHCLKQPCEFCRHIEPEKETP